MFPHFFFLFQFHFIVFLFFYISETTYKVETKTVTLDFSDRRLNYSEVKSVIKDLKISTLGNIITFCLSLLLPEHPTSIRVV